jgi:hypothetical protein
MSNATAFDDLDDISMWLDHIPADEVMDTAALPAFKGGIPEQVCLFE